SDVCSSDLFDEWQKGAGRLALAKREDGMYAAGIGGVVMSIPRQVGKTYFVSALVFALCTLLANQTVIWTAHRTRTHNETFKKMQSLTTKKLIAPYIRKVRTVNGEQEIEFYNGSRIMFGARESGFGDRKSTRLNSSHVSISYAVFCLKKKTTRMI